jgi:hypothetical protein
MPDSVAVFVIINLTGRSLKTKNFRLAHIVVKLLGESDTLIKGKIIN